ncbi:MAG TPA: PilW family protein [Steroidobacter sp.]|uniref:PilW family protein n=1 Tax=Steroidobacter sp. TaxID=1978227 RepID=UPI002ED961FF
MQVTIRNRMSGLSLVELMVALGISVLLLMGVVALFVSSRTSYETTERLSRIQENGRFALDQIAVDVRATGFNDCARAIPGAKAVNYRLNVTQNPFPPPLPGEEPEDVAPVLPDPRWNFAQPVFGIQATGDEFVLPAGMALADLDLEPVPNAAGDILVLRVPNREVRSMQLRMPQAQGFDPLTVRHFEPVPFQVGDTVMVSDCEARAYFQVTSYNPGTGEVGHAVTPATDGGSSGVDRPGNRSATFIHPFKNGATIVPISTMIYYLAPSRDNDPAVVDDPERADELRMSLYRKTGGAARSDEIAEGIERMEVRFGVDEDPIDTRVDTYVSADEVKDWNSVMTVQIALLARAPEEFGTDRDEQTYVMLSGEEEIVVGPFNDRNLRKVFTATLALRNQVID